MEVSTRLLLKFSCEANSIIFLGGGHIITEKKTINVTLLWTVQANIEVSVKIHHYA